MTTRALLTRLGIACLGVGVVSLAIGLVPTKRGGSALPRATPGAVGASLYTQNFRFDDDPTIVLGTAPDEALLHVRLRARFVERAVLALDRRPAACEQRIERGAARTLHVFDLPTLPPTYAVAFFMHGVSASRAPVGRDVIDCALVDPNVGSIDPQAAALAAVDPLVARSRLEYLVHPALLTLPARLYPARDKTLVRLPRRLAFGK